MGQGRSAGPARVYVWQRGARTRSEPGSADPLLSISGKRVRVEERARCLLRVAAGLPLAAAWHTAAAAVRSLHTAAAASPPLAVAYCHLPLQLAAAACVCVRGAFLHSHTESAQSLPLASDLLAARRFLPPASAAGLHIVGAWLFFPRWLFARASFLG